MRKDKTGSSIREKATTGNAAGPRIGDSERSADPVDAAAEQSFPASDPPAWIGMHAGTPTPHIAALFLVDSRSATTGE